MADAVVNQDAIRAAKITQALQLAAQAQAQCGEVANADVKPLPERLYPVEGIQSPVRAPQ